MALLRRDGPSHLMDSCLAPFIQASEQRAFSKPRGWLGIPRHSHFLADQIIFSFAVVSPCFSCSKTKDPEKSSIKTVAFKVLWQWWTQASWQLWAFHFSSYSWLFARHPLCLGYPWLGLRVLGGGISPKMCRDKTSDWGISHDCRLVSSEMFSQMQNLDTGKVVW